MPTVRYGDREVDCERGAVLRDVLLDAGLVPHNGTSKRVNCGGHGTCGTCAVAVDGPTSAPTARERWRLDFPPHDAGAGLRLTCQTRVEGDLAARKFPGFWGQHTDSAPVTDEE
ncbi:2Fe-2S iron-sulfur cluster-binding protein [Halosimplex pelagicum]|uniref:2Fe-2S iron-sulfur cluster binding domain-containing protein n=1 Tax=Halosimplex pelagicum TaxID=869886 RepID=A0A7D5TAZ7_9EURY|nr:2Fe-2S iron-sulfur cluster binding domain-containing protein [Halosimplex pelagicum]QLH83250.1 2Fe-2S iron-sulfur cluster binding domain-containing protein [Halosimplex pelagicum]